MTQLKTPTQTEIAKRWTPEVRKRLQILTQEARERADLVLPVLKESLCSNPYYEARRNDVAFWDGYMGTHGAMVKELEALLKSRSTPQSAPAPRVKHSTTS